MIVIKVLKKKENSPHPVESHITWALY